MRYLADFSERFSELSFESELNTEKLGAALGVTGSIVRHWKRGTRSISLANALRIAEHFNCSLEFLIGRTEDRLVFMPQPYLPFYERLRQLMDNRGVTWYRIVQDGIVSSHNLSVWKNGTFPMLETVIDIAEYFKLTLDQFVGRET